MDIETRWQKKEEVKSNNSAQGEKGSLEKYNYKFKKYLKNKRVLDLIKSPSQQQWFFT